ncbi:universal stress protein [Pseudomaricurvus alkylphenolicus]|uniref:universal stress protein n=1 Tax=Pseudomaricurvus alkylphenolicus TaxID=1306991 RepID=UPI001424785B|nr:universal stress protein [Pseudomaricurvus alkylphenolicus]NIB41021.1 universal stress protein [Pseudomaricurvus alkylphenolicus]
MRKSPILVWAAAEQTSARLESIVVALDVQFGDDQVACDRLNHQLLKQAFAISTALKCPITVLHAWQLYGKEFLKYWSKKDDLCIARLAEQEFNARRKQILKTIEQFDMSRIQLKFIEGPPKSCISDYLNTVESGLLIMGSVCRTGLPGLFIGNTAETVIDSVSCNVLTVKPSDFASPIQFESSKLERV